MVQTPWDGYTKCSFACMCGELEFKGNFLTACLSTLEYFLRNL